jgi:hypothetical protein
VSCKIRRHLISTQPQKTLNIRRNEITFVLEPRVMLFALAGLTCAALRLSRRNDTTDGMHPLAVIVPRTIKLVRCKR